MNVKAMFKVTDIMRQFEVKAEKVDKVSPNRPRKPAPVQKQRPQPEKPIDLHEDMPGTSA
ncbi:hypothetical protein CR513_62504, partial [Mucuna pruriens]